MSSTLVQTVFSQSSCPLKMMESDWKRDLSTRRARFAVKAVEVRCKDLLLRQIHRQADVIMS